MTERDYSHRKLADKLGLKPGMRVRITGEVGDDLRSAAAERIGDSLARRSDLDLIIAGVSSIRTAEDLLEELRPKLQDHAAIWLVTRKRGHPDYVKQEDLMPLAASLRLVDNKICSVDETHSAIRFVVPRSERGR
jgi:hypothetical protein